MNPILIAALLAQTTAPGPSAPSAVGPRTPGPAGPSAPSAVGLQTPGPAGPSTPSAGGPNALGPSGPVGSSVGSGDFFVGRESASPSQETVRAYDVRSLGLAAFKSNGGDGDSYLRVLPSLEAGRDHYEPDDPLVEPRLGETEWVNLLVDLIGRSAAYEGRGLDVTEDGLLLVSGPAELHAQVEAFLGFVGDIAHRETTLIVDVVRASGTRVVPSGIVTREEGAQIAERAERTFTLVCRPGAPGMHRSTTSMPVMLDYTVEVASAAALHDAMVVQAGVGTRLVAHAAPAAGGAHVALAVVTGDVEVRQRSRAVELGVRYTGEGSSPHTMMSAALVEDPRWSAVSAATGCFLGEDEALVLSVLGGDSATYFVVRLAEGIATSGEGLALDGKGVVAALDLGSLSPPSVGVRGTLVEVDRRPDLGSVVSDIASTSRSGGMFVARIASSGGGVLAQAVERSLPRGADQWTVGDWLIVRDPEGTEPFAAARGLLDANRGRTETFTVMLKDGERMLRGARLPIRIGSAGLATLTDERMDVSEYDVEIAQRSMAADPRPRHVFDGLAVWLRPVELSGGQVLVETRGLAQRVGERGELATEDDFVSHLERSSVESLGLAAQSVLRAGDDGQQRAIIGPPQGLHLVIEMN